MTALIEIQPMTDVDSFTVVILGTARSGTSLIAGALHHGGVDFGQYIHPIYECQELGNAMEDRNWAELDAIISRKNASPIWGWKRPSIIGHFDRVVPRLRSPVFIVVLRDLAAVALRNRIAYPEASDPNSLLDNMLTNLSIQQATINKAASSKRPMVVLSAEKMFQKPMETVRETAKFLGLDLDLRRAERFLARGNQDYDRMTRNRNAPRLDPK